MKKDKDADNIEAIAMKFLSQTDSSKHKSQNSFSTLKDSEIFGKMTPSTIHSRSRSKVLSIVSNNMIIAEYNFEFFSQKKVLYKIPNKIIEDIEVFCEDDDKEEGYEDNPHLEICFALNYELVYHLLNDFYSPLIQLLGSIEDFTNFINENIVRMERWLGKANPFEEFEGRSSALYSMTILEIIAIGFVVFLYQINLNCNYELNKGISQDDNEQIYQLISESIGRLYESILLLITYNSNQKHTEEFEALCRQYVNDYSNEINALSKEAIALRFNENEKEIKLCLIRITEIAINYIYQGVNNSLISSVSSEFIEEINYFEKILLMLKENKEIEHETIKAFVMSNLTNFKGIVLQSNISTPYLPPMEARYKYTLVVDLDETLVHFVEEEDKAYVQVRPYADHFLNEMKKHFEIVIFTAAAEDYADIVLKELDKNNAVNYRLYRKHTVQQNGFFLKDLSRLGRDINKMCIIDNNKENFNLQQENGLHISSFMGEQKDNELLLLSKDLMLIIKENNDDIRITLNKIRGIMAKRYNDQL